LDVSQQSRWISIKKSSFLSTQLLPIKQLLHVPGTVLESFASEEAENFAF